MTKPCLGMDAIQKRLVGGAELEALPGLYISRQTTRACCPECPIPVSSLAILSRLRLSSAFLRPSSRLHPRRPCHVTDAVLSYADAAERVSISLSVFLCIGIQIQIFFPAKLFVFFTTMSRSSGVSSSHISAPVDFQGRNRISFNIRLVTIFHGISVQTIRCLI